MRVFFRVERLPLIEGRYDGEVLTALGFLVGAEAAAVMQYIVDNTLSPAAGSLKGEFCIVDSTSPSRPLAPLSLYRQLCMYAAGKLKNFDVKFRLHGTEFQRSVWNKLLEIPYAQTRAYSGVAAELGNAKACRAVAQAAHNNPIAIIVPCHRLIGKDGSLVGYAKGVAIKRALLDIENSGAMKPS